MGPIPEITMIKVDLLKEIGKPEQIEEELLILKQAFPDDLKVLKTVIGYYEENGDKEKAINLIKELVDSEPENGVAHFILARHYLELEEIESFLISLYVVAKSSEVEVYDKMLLSQPLFSMGKEYDDAMYQFSSRLAETHPENAKAIALNAEVLNNIGNSKAALKEYRRALELDQVTFQLWTSVLAFESAHREYQALYEDAQKAIELFPSLPFVYYTAAEGAMMLEKYDEAEEFLRMGEMYILDDPIQEARFAKRFGENYFRQEKKQAAHKSFEKALQKSDEPSILWSYAYHLAFCEQDYQKAMEIVKPLSGFDLKSLDAFYIAGYVYIKNNALEEAEKLLNKGLEKIHFKAELYDLLGDLHLQKNDTEEALLFWNKALENDSRNTSINKKIKDKKYYAPQYF